MDDKNKNANPLGAYILGLLISSGAVAISSGIGKGLLVLGSGFIIWAILQAFLDLWRDVEK